MNILTFDIEEWYFEHVKPKPLKSNFAQYERLLNEILDLLDLLGFKATFFILGKIATLYPSVVQLIVERGHELGCHSNSHIWLTHLTREQLFEDTRSAIDALEQCSGKKVLSYRAPAFSIGKQNSWAFELLAQCGIERDASIFPAKRDFGGFPSFESQLPSIISCNGVQIKEFPIPLVKIWGKSVAFSGGGYFRFFPLSYIAKRIKQSGYSMTYFHIADFIAKEKRLLSKEEFEANLLEKGTLYNRYKRYIKSNLGTDGAYHKLKKLLHSTQFLSLEAADKLIDWSKVKRIEL